MGISSRGSCVVGGSDWKSKATRACWTVGAVHRAAGACRKAKAEQVLSLYRDKYFDLNVRHFHEKLREDHQIGLSYTWVKQAFRPTDEDLSVGTPALQAAGLVEAQGQARRASQTA